MSDKKGFTEIKNKQDIHRILAKELGKGYSEYRREWAQAEAFNSRSFPVHMDIETTNRCNMRCVMCEHGQRPKQEYFRTKKELDPSVVYRVIEEAAAGGIRSINFNGTNEPLLTKELDSYVKFAREKGIIDLFMHTNAMLLAPARSRSLIEAGLTKLFCSIDGFFEETYSKIRVGGNFNKVLDNLESFMTIRDKSGKRYPLVGVCFVRLPNNRIDERLFTEFWSDRADFIVAQEYVKVPTIHFDKQKSDSNRMNEKMNFRCSMPWKRMMILATGDIVPCCTLYSRFVVVGNIYKNTLKEVWNSEQMDQLRKMHKEGKWYLNPICKQCVEGTFAKI